ncbi:MAG: polysaccharide export protein [Woeseiaceae bacterium]|nr:polysaccharide export protein [Woeseiaceae bacterium]
MKTMLRLSALVAFLVLLLGCAGGSATVPAAGDDGQQSDGTEYIIGPGDMLQVYVWDNPELTVTIPVRPDGMITIPLVEDMRAVGKTPTLLARDVEEKLAEYVRTPQVNIIVTNFRGTYREQIRVVGQAVSPQSLSYQSGMTLLDVMIEVGGLTEFAAGNRAKVIRWEDNVQRDIRVRLKDLISDGDISENIEMKPGDVLIIPESMF